MRRVFSCQAEAKQTNGSKDTADDSKDEGFQSLCRVCRSQNVEYTAEAWHRLGSSFNHAPLELSPKLSI